MKYAINNGIIDLDNITDCIKDMEDNKILKQHPYRIWKGKDERYRTYLYDETKPYQRRLIAKSTENALKKEIIRDYRENHESRTKIYQVFNDWMDFAREERTITISTITKYTSDYDRYIKNTYFNDLDILTIVEQDIIKFLKNLVSQKKKNDDKISKKNFSNLKIIINGIFTYAKTEKEINCISISNALQNFKMADSYFKYTIKKDSEEVYSDDEIAKLTKHIVKNYINGQYKGTRELGILFIALTGLRIGELVSLKTSDEDDNKLYVQRTESAGKDKNGHTIIYIKDYPKTVESMNGIELSDSAAMVWNWIKKTNYQNGTLSNFVFFEEKLGRLTKHHFRPTLKRLCKECNIPFKSPHKLRKTYASMLFENDVEKKVVQSQMRHKDISTTHKYYEFSMRSRNAKRRQINNADVIKIKQLKDAIKSAQIV